MVHFAVTKTPHFACSCCGCCHQPCRNFLLPPLSTSSSSSSFRCACRRLVTYIIPPGLAHTARTTSTLAHAAHYKYKLASPRSYLYFATFFSTYNRGPLRQNAGGACLYMPHTDGYCGHPFLNLSLSTPKVALRGQKKKNPTYYKTIRLIISPIISGQKIKKSHVTKLSA